MLSLLSLLFPQRCIGCQTRGVALCENCITSIPLSYDTGIKGIYAVYEYGNIIVERVIRTMKYHRHAEAARILARHAAPYIAEYVSTQLQSITSEHISLVPIPQHRSKTNQRGFSQSALIAKELAKVMKSEVVPILIKYRETKPQAHLRKKHERSKNIANSMRCASTPDPKRIYILIDDVTTTGATFEEAKRALSDAGATKIRAVALAHGYKRR